MVPRVVLDTNLALSALLFTGSNSTRLRQGWQGGTFKPLISKTTANELIRVLAYPKFRLSDDERDHLLADYFPFCDTVQMPDPPPVTPPCRDPFDVPFLELALVGNADYLVTGDRDLLCLAPTFECPILNASDFFERLNAD